MKPRGMLSTLSGIFDPAEIRRARKLRKQWDELDDVPTIVHVGNSKCKEQEMINMLLDRIETDIKHVKDIVNRS